MEGLLTKVSDAVVVAKDYLAESLRPGARDDDSEDEAGDVVYGPDGMPFRAPSAFSAPAPPRPAAPGPSAAAEVILECVHAVGVDLGQLPAERRSVPLAGGEERWLVGRQTHPELFVRLVPDEALRICISRCHFELARAEGMAGFCLRKHSPNAMLLDGVAVVQDAVPVHQGALLGLCAPNDPATPFLVFRVHVQDRPAPRAGSWVERQLQQQQEALQMQLPRTQHHSEQRAQAPQAPPWKDNAPSAPFRLVCVSAVGTDVAVFPPETKTIGVHAHEPLVVGRQHQIGFFEGLLGMEQQRYLTIVGRSHIEIAPVPGDGGAFKVANLSANPIVIEQQRFNKGQHAFVRPPTCIMFIASKTTDASDAFPFLTLSFEPTVGQAPAGQLLPTSPAMAVGTGACGPAAAAVAAMQGGWQAGGNSVPTSPLPPASAAHQQLQEQHHQQQQQQQLQLQLQEQQMLQQQQQQAAQNSFGRPTLPVTAGFAAQQEPEAAFWLELGGTAVRPGSSAGSRQIQGRADGVTVGRLHQRQQLSEALSDEVAQYVSREHFRIERNAMCGGFNLIALSSNLLWLCRGGQRVEAPRNGQLPLAHGDVLQFYTGASDFTPDGPGCRGTIYWIFYDSASTPMNAGTLVEETVPIPKQAMSPRSMHIPATACHDARPPSLSGMAPAGAMDAYGQQLQQQQQQQQQGWPESPGFGWQQQQGHTAYAAGPACAPPRGWEQQLPTPGTPVDPRSPWSGGATPPRSPRSKSPRAAGWGQQQANMDLSLNQYGNRPAPMFGGAAVCSGGKGGGRGGGFFSASSNTYYEKAITD